MNKVLETVSVVMAAYNSEKTIECAIRSIMNQSYSNWELIVINDCSTDNTPYILSSLEKSDNRIVVINNDMNKGVSFSRFEGVKAAKGKWIAILDSDDAWASDKLEKQLNVAHEKDADLVFSGSAFMDDSGNEIDWVLHVPEKIGYKQLLKQNLISNSSVLVKKSKYVQHYAFGDDLHEDFATWLGMTKSGTIAYGIDEPLLIYRLAKSSKSSNKIKAAKMNWKTYRHVGLNKISAAYYMIWYMFKGVFKYHNIRRGINNA